MKEVLKSTISTSGNYIRNYLLPAQSGLLSTRPKIDFLLRLGIMGCFVGHGFWGILTKTGWLPLFHVFNVPDATAYQLMPLIGAMDIFIGVMAFFAPTRALLVWATFWTIFTALLRPLAGLGMSEFVERAGNYGVPLVLLYTYGLPGKGKPWFSRLTPFSPFGVIQLRWVERLLRWSLFMLLAGHGGLAFFVQHQNIVNHFEALGISPEILTLKTFGILEMMLALIVLIVPRLPGLMIFILLYKLACELMFPISGHFRDTMETIERFGDYVIPAALWLIYHYENRLSQESA